MTVLILDDFKRICQILEDYAFLFSLFDFYQVCRHFILGSSVNVIYFFCPKSYSSTACIHGCVAASDNCNLIAQLDFFVSYYVSQEVDAADYAFSILSFAAYSCGHPGTDTEKYCIVTVSYIFERNVRANLSIGYYFNSRSFDN